MITVSDGIIYFKKYTLYSISKMFAFNLKTSNDARKNWIHGEKESIVERFLEKQNLSYNYVAGNKIK